jgi:raffinose/stachyose/melibiose transport system permease protein
LTIQRGFMVYDVNLALTNGGPFKSTELISMFVYEKGVSWRSSTEWGSPRPSSSSF